MPKEIMIAGVLPKSEEPAILELYECIKEVCEKRFANANVTSPMNTKQFIEEFKGSDKQKNSELATMIMDRITNIDIIIGNFTHWPSEWKAYELWIAAAQKKQMIFVRKDGSWPIAWVIEWNNSTKIIYSDLKELKEQLFEILGNFK